LAPRAGLDAPGPGRRGRIGKPGRDGLYPPNQSTARRPARPDNFGMAYLKAMSALGWEADCPLYPFVSSEVETPRRHAFPMGFSTSLDTNGIIRRNVRNRSFSDIAKAAPPMGDSARQN
jgi:hypothetical protein